MTFHEGDIVAEHDRPCHVGKVVDICSEDGDAKIVFIDCTVWKLCRDLDWVA